uniref:Uncharacterized protein n=1 Tax=Cucumis melo TaxID=3656 RepID=A0A9I9EGE1_CUCME
MAWLSFLSFCVHLSVVGLQIWHFKTFFEEKKQLSVVTLCIGSPLTINRSQILSIH